MLIIKTNQPNTLVVTVSQNSELTNPEYLFSFTHIFSKENVTFIPTDISTHKSRYDEFYFVEGTNAGQIHFPYQGQYLYSIWEQPQGSGNLNPALAYNVVENGDAQVFPSTASTMDSQYDIFISNNEDNSNIIFAPGEPNPTPNSTATPTPTPSTTPVLSPTPSMTPTHTPTPSSTPPVLFNSFVVGTGSTFTDACNNLSTGNTIVVYANIGGGQAQCNPCLPLNCFPCVNTSDTWWLDAAFTIPLPNMWIANCIDNNVCSPGSQKRQQIVNQQIVSGTFTDC
jgi:hypothetical protein